MLKTIMQVVAWPTFAIVMITILIFWICRVYRKNAITDLTPKEGIDW